MIVARVRDPSVRSAICAAVHPEEDVVTEPALVMLALKWDSARLVVIDGHLEAPPWTDAPVLRLDDTLLERWEVARRSGEVPAPRHQFLTDRLEGMLARSVQDATWVDTTLADLGRAAGMPLPPSLRGFARRILEFPAHYTSLRELAGVSGATRGALKARFRRRGLASPYTYLRWLRTFAVAEFLSDQTMPLAKAAARLGFSSAGNLCRTTATITNATPSDLRTARGRNALIIRFAWQHLTPAALRGWADLDDLFARRVA